jgi:hypothetical protein
MEIHEMRIFENDDDGYESWVGRHGGYVLTKTASRPGFMLHESECAHLAKDNPGMRLTAKPRRWSGSRGVLADWTAQKTGERPLLCQTCM